MPEVHYKFKSSLSFEVIKFSESSITVGVLKDFINQKQSIKTSGFDLKLKDTQGKVYVDDDEIIDLKSKIIVSRVPKIPKTQINTMKKEIISATNISDIPIVSSNSEKVVNQPEEKSDGELTKVDSLSEKPEQTIPDILKCCLCNQLMKDSMQIKCCKKNYCHECITGYLFDPDISGSLECPDCKSIVSIKDANLTDNLKIRNMVYDFQNGKLDSNTTDEGEITTQPKEDLLMHLENVHEVEISGDDLNIPDNDIPEKSFEHVDSSQVDEVFMPDNKTYKEMLGQDQNSPAEPAIHNTISPADITESMIDYSNGKNQSNHSTEINQIEQHYQGRSYTNPISMDQQFTNKSGIPVINTSSNPNVTNNSIVKDLSNPSIHELDFDPVMYMTFLKIVGENCPDELRKILSNNNESIHISKDSRKTSSSTRRSREDDYHDKHLSKKSRYDMETEEPRYKKTYTPIDKHSEHRYYENVEKKSSRIRSRSKEYYPKKSDGYSNNNKRSRDYEMPRDRDYYPSNNGPRYRNSENPNNYQDDRHKYRPNYNSSLNRMKSAKYKRPMDR